MQQPSATGCGEMTSALRVIRHRMVLKMMVATGEVELDKPTTTPAGRPISTMRSASLRRTPPKATLSQAVGVRVQAIWFLAILSATLPMRLSRTAHSA